MNLCNSVYPRRLLSKLMKIPFSGEKLNKRITILGTVLIV